MFPRIWGTVAVVAAIAFVALGLIGPGTVATPVENDSLAVVFGGEDDCYKDDTKKCPPSSAAMCVGECARNGLGLLDPCAGKSFLQLNPNYKWAKGGQATGTKGTKPDVSKLCGNDMLCGPLCQLSAVGGLICPFSGLPRYENQRVEDATTGSCDDGSDTDGGTGGMTPMGMLTLAGRNFNAFRVR